MNRVGWTERGAALLVFVAASALVLLAVRAVTRAAQERRATAAALAVDEPAATAALQKSGQTAHAVDEFHPDRAPRPDGTRPPLPAPAFGGRAIVHMDAMPKHLNHALDNIANARRIAYETHATLLLRNWDTHVLEPDVCASWDVEDQVILTEPPASGAAPFGRVSAEGEEWVVTPVSAENPLREPARYPKAKVVRVERGTVFTFHLRPDVVWHDGHPFDARDVEFSLSIYKNPKVRCEDKRFQFQKVARTEVLSPRAVRVTYAEQYFMAEAGIGDLFLLPAHLYDLTDPDNATADPEFRAQKLKANTAWKPTPEEQAEYINTNPHNKQFVGLGAYRVVAFTNDQVEATRFDRYFDPARAGYLDTLRWRSIPDTSAAFRAFVNGDLDFLDTISADDYFSSTTESPEFLKRAYRGWHYTSIYSYVAWNLARPQFADPRVRVALAHLFDFDEFKRTFYRGLAEPVTGPFSRLSPAYNHEVQVLANDSEAATRLLTEAGWYDRDGDGVIDRDGQPFTIELTMQPGNAAAQAIGSKLQENLAHVGIQLTLAPLEMTAIADKRKTGNFDAVMLGWSPPYEGDPGQIWHSVPAGAEKGSNFIGFADAKIDELIEAGRKELDLAKRAAIWRQIHRRLYELQPYLFAFNPQRKFVMNRALRGFQSMVVDPNYVLRRWYYPAGTPGTRATAIAK